MTMLSWRAFWTERSRVWLPQAKPIAKRPLKLVIADHVAGRWNAGGGIGSEADLVCPGFRLGLMAEPNNAQRAFDVIHDGIGTPMRSVSHPRGRLSSDDAAPRRGPEAAARPGRFCGLRPGDGGRAVLARRGNAIGTRRP